MTIEARAAELRVKIHSGEIAEGEAARRLISFTQSTLTPAGARYLLGLDADPAAADAQERDRNRDREIAEQLRILEEHTECAHKETERAALALEGVLALYDAELAEGPDGADAKTKLDQAATLLRDVSRTVALRRTKDRGDTGCGQ